MSGLYGPTGTAYSTRWIAEQLSALGERIDALAGGSTVSLAAKADQTALDTTNTAVALNTTYRTRNNVVNVRDYGAVGDGQLVWYDASMTAGNNLLTCATRTPFTPAHVGSIIKVVGAGTGGGTLFTSITQYVSPSSVRLAINAATTGTGMSAGFGHDDGPAFLAAFQALVATRGGTVVVPESTGGYVIYSQQDVYPPGTPRGVNTVTLQGSNMGSRIIPLAGPATTCLAFYGPPGCDNLVVRDVTFIGVPGAEDAGTVIDSMIDKITFYNVNFYGVRASAAVVRLGTTEASLYNTTFRGCAVTGGPVVLAAAGWRHLVIEDMSFPDFATWRDAPNDYQVGKTTQVLSAITDSWLKIEEPQASSGSNSQQNGVRIRNFRGDEGAKFGIRIAPPTSRITWVDIENIFVMVMTTPGSAGISASKVDRLNVRNGRFHSNTWATETSIALSDVGVAELDRVIADTTAPIITADAACGTLLVQNSTYGTLTSSATRTVTSSGLVSADLDSAANSSVATFSRSGALAVATGKGRFRFPFAASILGVSAAVNTAPTGAAVLLDVNKNGTTIFTTQANRPTIAAGTNGTAAEVTNMDVTAVAAGDYLTVDVDQVGSTVAGSDLTALVRYRRA